MRKKKSIILNPVAPNQIINIQQLSSGRGETWFLFLPTFVLNCNNLLDFDLTSQEQKLKLT